MRACCVVGLAYYRIGQSYRAPAFVSTAPRDARVDSTRNIACIAMVGMNADMAMTLSCIDEQQHVQQPRECSAERIVVGGSAASAVTVERSATFSPCTVQQRRVNRCLAQCMAV